MAYKTALIAGGAGFVGSAVVRLLLAEGGARVVVADSLLHGRREHVPDSVELLVGDLSHAGFAREVFEAVDPDWVLNCCGDTFVPDAYDVPGRFVANNAGALAQLIRESARAGVDRLVHVSTTEVYGDVGRGVSIDESFPMNPVNTYAVTKLAADRLCGTMAQEHGVDVRVARIFNCYGPRETHPYVIPEIFRQLRAGSRVELGDLDAERDFSWVFDTAGALCRLMLDYEGSERVFNIGSGVGTSIRELCRLSAEVAGVTDLELVVDASRFRRRAISSFRCDNGRVRTELGWTPEVALREGLLRTWEWYERHGGRWCWE